MGREGSVGQTRTAQTTGERTLNREVTPRAALSRLPEPAPAAEILPIMRLPEKAATESKNSAPSAVPEAARGSVGKADQLKHDA